MAASDVRKPGAPVFLSFVRSKQSVIFPVLDVLLNVFNWGFHVIVSWRLNPSDYGQLNSLLALLSLMMVLGVGLQLLTARHVAALGGNQGVQSVAPLLRLAAFLGLGTAGAGILALPLLMWLTRGSALSVVLVLFTFALNAVLSVRRGVAQGQTTFLSLNGSFYLEVIVKLVALAVLLSLWPRPESALVAVSIGMIASLLASRNVHLDWKGQGESPRIWLKRLAPVVAASFFLYFFSSVDMLLVNRLLPQEAGMYAVAVKYGQILFFAALSVGTVFVPRLSQSRRNFTAFLTNTKRLLLLVGGASVVGTVLGFTLLRPTAGFVFGKSYANAGGLIGPAMFAYGLLALCFCLVNVLVVLEKRAYLGVLLTAALAVSGLLITFHSTSLTVLFVLSGTYAVLLGTLVYLATVAVREVPHVDQA